MEPLIAHPKNKEQLKALKIDSTTEERPYSPEFVEKILDGERTRKSGKRV